MSFSFGRGMASSVEQAVARRIDRDQLWHKFDLKKAGVAQQAGVHHAVCTRASLFTSVENGAKPWFHAGGEKDSLIMQLASYLF
ncbi:hypothetical protein [Pantoea sp.]|uniref:hypothetical protein n=1 Tax=Pantoea sp. TaxID=69393 RepID=UPI0031CF3C31